MSQKVAKQVEVINFNLKVLKELSKYGEQYDIVFSNGMLYMWDNGWKIIKNCLPLEECYNKEGKFIGYRYGDIFYEK